MRIVHLLQSLEMGGLEKMVVHLAVGARQRGHDVHVVAYLADGPLRGELEDAGVGVTVLPSTSGLSPLLPVRVARVLRAQRATHLHTHHLGPFLYGTPAARLCGVSHLHTEHSHEFYDGGRRRLAGWCMHRVADVVACADEVSAFHADAFGVRPAVIENGVPGPEGGHDDLARGAAREALGLDHDVPVAIAVGRLAAEKDHVALVTAFAAVVRRVPSAQLVIVGEGPCRADIEGTIASAGLGAHVRLLGARRDVPALLPAADLVVFSSRREALPLALLEGLAAGVPFVGTAVGDLPALAHAGAGVAVAAAELGPAIAEFLSSAEARAEAKARGLALWRARFSVDAMVDAYIERYAAMGTSV